MPDTRVPFCPYCAADDSECKPIGDGIMVCHRCEALFSVEYEPDSRRYKDYVRDLERKQEARDE